MPPTENNAFFRDPLEALASVLARMKAVAHRPKDLLDIQGIIQTHPNLDRKRIRDWVTQFAELLEMPELWEDIAGWL